VALSDVTPIVLTFNEEENVGRTLKSLGAFPRVVVVDSVSRDRTEEIARTFSNIAWFSRPWGGFQEQWSFAFRETDISTPFVLALDADMQVSTELEREIAETVTRRDVDGGTLAFEYRIRGVPLAGSLYPRQLRLLRLSKAQVGEQGHAHHLEVDGRVVALEALLVHDDRKPLEMFVRAQLGYSERELPRLVHGETAGLPARLRRSFPFTPIAVWAWAWIRAGGPFCGAAARRYALERLLYEAMLRWRVEDRLLGEEHGTAPHVGVGAADVGRHRDSE
jgi:glycosyltransferase involved in cell wall biosynthesis